MKKKIISGASIVFLVILAVFIIRQSNRTVTKTGFYFDTVIQVTLYHGEEDLLEDCFALADRYESYFSTTKPDSDIAKINAAGGKPVQVHGETLELIKKGLEYGKMSEGRFDITIGKLSALWDFDENTGTIPSQERIEEALKTVDYRAVTIEGDTVSVENPDAQIDLGGIAKGYIADQMKAYLVQKGVTQGVINLGGNVLVIGEKDDGSGYHIGIQKPFDERGEVIADVEVKDQTVVSSGVYERYFYKDEKLYHHLLDTKTGYPIANDLYGVSIICDKSVDGDALSTTAFALGLEEGMRFIENLDGVRAAFVTDDNTVHWTK